MTGLPPGNILQYLYLKERLKVLLKEGKTNFIEVGSGNGNVSNIFLKMNFNGIGFDLNKSACLKNISLNKKYINNGVYEVLNDDFISFELKKKYDVIISCMVMEHMPNDILQAYLQKCKKSLTSSGLIISFVPASMKYWGIEDEIAGHIKRYEFDDIIKLANSYSFNIRKNIGLTFPISNWLLRVSNFLVQRAEKEKLNLSQKERTIYTGNREVVYKTTFPKIFNLILNPITLYPFHVLQKLFKKHPRNMVIYSELEL